MNYYDEEITISGPDSKHLSSVQMDRSSRSDAAARGQTGATAAAAQSTGGQRAARQRNLQLQGNSADDDGLLQDIIDHDDEADDSDDDDDDSELQMAGSGLGIAATAPRPQTRPGSTRNAKQPQIADDQLSFGSSDEAAGGEHATGMKLAHQKLPLPAQQRRSAGQAQEMNTFNLTPDKWEQLPLQPELKEIFPYILKYTPQTIETPYHLQPFIPEFVPAVGDVDAMLKVQAPALLQPQRQRELDEQLQRLGLMLLDEPSGTQSEPSLLNMKLRSVLSGSRGTKPRHGGAYSATMVPTARSAKDIERWIGEVEQVHMTQSMYDAQPRKDIDALLEHWPHSYAEPATKDALDQAYHSCLQQQISLGDYVRVLCERFGVEGPLETQSDYIHNVQTLFALYLAASQAWE
ncbi:uncharacterized protein LOC117564770 [Drosophila albomicans]|uniref:Intraflagellar transport protein 46 homolog n=1 Tax=Drosophila albomicans TaxID=7291 RepID=A0A6P8W7G3_DROAB|nr:uncharacterized protein LOC117564770 [Drosophila albomicans]